MRHWNEINATHLPSRQESAPCENKFSLPNISPNDNLFACCFPRSVKEKSLDCFAGCVVSCFGIPFANCFKRSATKFVLRLHVVPGSPYLLPLRKEVFSTGNSASRTLVGTPHFFPVLFIANRAFQVGLGSTKHSRMFWGQACLFQHVLGMNHAFSSMV